ncbi:glutamate 5-kinase [Allomyces macrogynus ATCC 38327]|uniref:Glutamate 5-kinase n=1 Tax=Allomyces macrogynus (strain ATCC 38327) TaxID=578462 RepID=A0A0L0SMZ0_ALLM3|nr:glutamate 5-kinase [Allomyces macrogynus ATCC 38327]|eukprot:KNE63750.1 glutamate 5-kinase [Allomyces macrogynus ATCC 38327]
MASNSQSSSAQTVVIKVGTSSICDEVTHRPRLALLAALVETIVALREAGHRVVLVTSGAIGVGLRATNEATRPKKLARLQALAAIGQAQLMAQYTALFSPFDVQVAQILISRGDVADRHRYLNACNALRELLEMGMVPVVNENDAVSVAEIKFGDNDTLSAVVARMVAAQWLFLLTDVDALYTDNPRTNPAAKPVRVVRDLLALREQVKVPAGAGSSVGTGGMETKLVAAELATAAGVTTVILNAQRPRDLIEAMTQPLPAPAVVGNVGDEVKAVSHLLGTRFVPPQESAPLPDRKWWIRHGLRPAGTVIVDMGAMNALADHRASLFPAGIVGVIGQFAATQAVTIVAVSNTADRTALRFITDQTQLTDPVTVGKGLVNYSAAELRLIMGHQSAEVAELLGYAESEAVIDRSSIVLEPGVGRGRRTSAGRPRTAGSSTSIASE